MNTLYAKTVRSGHKNFKSVIHEPKRLFESYSEEEMFKKIIKESKNNLLSGYQQKRFDEYKEIGFPLFRRINLNRPDFKAGNFGKPCGSNTISDIDEQGIELIKKYDFEGTDRKYLLMAELFSNCGYYIKTQDDQDAGIIKLWYDDTSIFENSLFSLKPGSKAVIIRQISGNYSDKLRNGVIRAIIERNAELVLINIIKTAKADSISESGYFSLSENSRLKVIELSAGQGKFVSNYVYSMDGKNSVLRSAPMFMGSDESVSDIFHTVKFNAPAAIGVLEAKGVLKDRSSCIFRGTLDINKGAFDADGKESSFTLSLSPHARMQTIPGLLVAENKVNASHAATLGSISEDKLYYMMNRGFSKAQAKKLISMGIFDELTEALDSYDKDIAQETVDYVYSIL